MSKEAKETMKISKKEIEDFYAKVRPEIYPSFKHLNPYDSDLALKIIDQLHAEKEKGKLEELLKLAYRNWLEDPDVAWAELGEQLCDGLCEAMGDGEYQKWMEALKGGE